MRNLLLTCLLALGLAAASPAHEIRLAVTDLVGLEELQREFGPFVAVLEGATGHTVRFLPVTNRTAASEALRFKHVDFVITGPAEYVVIRKRTDAYPVVGLSRPDYFSGIIVLATSGITDCSQLKGRKVAFSEVGSTSGHLAPMQILADNGVDPTKDIEAVHLKRKVSFEALKRGDVAAWGENWTKFLQLRSKDAESGGLQPGAFRVIARGPDLPSDMLMAGAHVDKAIVERVRQAFVSHSGPLIEAILAGEDNQKYKGMAFLPGIRDADYDPVRAIYRTIGYPEYADFVGE